MPPVTDLWILLSLLVWVPVVAVVHEAGHALAASPAGYRVTSFGIGRGRTVLRVGLPGGAVFHVGWIFATGGACVAIPRTPELGPRAALFHAGGVFAQIVFGVVLWLLPASVAPAWWLDAGAHFNLLVAAWNLLPWRVGTMASDGWWLLSRLGAGVVTARPLVAQKTSLEGVLRHEQRVGSAVGCWYGARMLAWADVQLGRTAAAQQRLDAQPMGSPDPDPHLHALDAVVRAELARRTGAPLEALRRVTEARALGGVSSEDPLTSDDLLTIAEVHCRAALDDVAGARAALGRLAGVGGTLGREAAAASLAVALAEGRPDRIADAARHLVRQSTRALLDPLAAATLLHQAAQSAEHAEDAARWHARAVGLVRATLGACAADDRPAVDAQLQAMLASPRVEAPAGETSTMA